MGANPDFSMKMAELSATSGVSVPTIKLYLREGLLPPGWRTSPNQALYGAPHVQRLRLIRAMRDVAGLPIAAIKTVTSVLDDPTRHVHNALGAVQAAITPVPAAPEAPAVHRAQEAVDTLIARRGWRTEGNPARESVVGALSVIYTLGADNAHSDTLLDVYAEAAERIAAADLAGIAAEPDSDKIVETAVTWTILGDTILTGLRRIAQEDASVRTFGPAS
jgi:DNA-binding transcriptional MerR regulator